MPVETGTYISDLVATNPVGATDPKSQGDDHIRLLKSTIKATFPNITGAVTASHTQLSTLDEGTLPACDGSQLTNLNGDEVKTGTVADARLSSNVPLKNANNVFTRTGYARSAAALFLSSEAPGLRFSETDQAADNSDWLVAPYQGIFRITPNSDSGTIPSTTQGIHISRSGSTATQIALGATAITFNGVNVTDYARLSQPNTFTTHQVIDTGATGDTQFFLRHGNNASNGWLFQLDGSNVAYVWNYENAGMQFATANTLRMEIGGSGGVTFSTYVAAPTIAQSTSTTLAAGQVHAIDGNATLPNMAAGQWVTVINNGSSARTVTKNGSDTMYWTTTGASVTSVTIPARGAATFICADGTNVYASGAISGAS